MARILGLAVLALLQFGAATRATPQASPLTPRDSALHALNRLAYGPRPGEVDRVAAMGVMHWIEQQLVPERLPDRVLAARERVFDLAPSGQAAPGDREEELLQQVALVRGVLSERQLREVMTDFWVNHFNVYWAKGADHIYLPPYIEQVIRPRVLGRFEDLLIATAQSPAMLFFLDNWLSVAAPPRPEAAEGDRRGPNENYARELLELHTLGVDGGYTQHDVIEVARLFTGWGIGRPAQAGKFQFTAADHDSGTKIIRGVRFPPGHGMDEGLRLLHLLANDPATMRHVSRKLCARFVSDTPPAGCVAAATAAWTRTQGDIREVLRAIFHSPEFWARQAQRTKVKTPLEFLVSAVRAVGGDPDTTPRLAELLNDLGQPLYLEPSPAGYPEEQEQWVTAGALLHRMNAAMEVARGQSGVSVALEGVLPVTRNPDSVVDAANHTILGGILTAHSREMLRAQAASLHDPDEVRALVVGLALGGPEFQQQ